MATPPTGFVPTLRAALAALADGDRPSLPECDGNPPILLLHGFATSSRVLAPLARHLGRRLGRPVIRVRLGGALPLHLGDIRETARAVQREIERVGSKARVPYVDVVGHSLGGLVATYLLKVLDGGRLVRRVVTLGTPHQGAPLALAGALVLGLFCRALWQMIPGAPLLAELARLPVPERSELIAVGSDADGLVPHRFSRLLPAPRQRNARLPGLGHVDYLWSPACFGFVRDALAR
jgi:triacylglycerol esterase/lipase EstA (alpha/beta hydrolase family)